MSVVVIVVIGIMLVAFVALVLLWAITEELPRSGRVPLYERLEAGDWGVRLLAVGRRRMRAMRVVNEVLGGDLGAAKAITEHPPAIVVEGISAPLADEIVAELAAAGAEAERFPTGDV